MVPSLLDKGGEGADAHAVFLGGASYIMTHGHRLPASAAGTAAAVSYSGNAAELNPPPGVEVTQVSDIKQKNKKIIYKILRKNMNNYIIINYN